MVKGSDPYGSTETSTEYDGQHQNSRKDRPSGSLTAVIIAAAFLLIAVGGFLFWPQTPGGDASPGEAVILQEPGAGPNSEK